MAKNLEEFDSLSVLSTDYLAVARDAENAGKATVQAVVNAGVVAAVAAVPDASAPWPYVLASDATTYAGSGSEGAIALVKSVTVPANTLAANGARLVVTLAATGSIAVDMLGLERTAGDLDLFAANGSFGGTSQRIEIVRTGATAGRVMAWPGPAPGESNPSAEITQDWSQAITLRVVAGAGVSVVLVQVDVQPG